MVLTFDKREKVTVITATSEESEDENVQNDEFEVQKSGNEDEDGSSHESSPVGNPSWADAIANVLRTQKPKNKKNIILAKAKKDTDVRKKEPQKAFDVVDTEGTVQEVETVKKAKKRKKSALDLDNYESSSDDERDWQESQRKRNEKLLWERMGRTKPNPLSKDRERQLSQIATKGVVQLFNAVRQHQKKLEGNLKTAGNSEVKQEKVMKSVSKGAFLDLLKGCPSQKISNSSEDHNKDTSKSENRDTSGKGWNVLKEDFLLGASLKDWDKVETAKS